MKKVFSVIFALSIIISCFCVTASALSGDVDSDGAVTATDARLALRCSVQLEELSEDALKRADTDFDGVITATDARYILRMSVGLEEAPVPPLSDYEILCTGNFSVKGSMTDAEDASSDIELYVTENSVCMTADFSGVNVGMLIKDEECYIIYDTAKAALQLSETIMTMAGISEDEIFDGVMLDFAYYPSRSELEVLKTEEYKGQECTVYAIRTEVEYTEIYMAGDRLVRMIGYTPDGSFLSDIEIDEISPDVPEGKTDIPSDYKLYKGIGGMFSFMQLLEI